MERERQIDRQGGREGEGGGWGVRDRGQGTGIAMGQVEGQQGQDGRMSILSLFSENTRLDR